MGDDLPVGSETLAGSILEWLDAHAAYGVFATDTHLRIVRWNRWVASVTNRSADDVVGRSLFEVFPSLVERGLDQHYTDALAGEVKILSHSLHRFIIPATRAGSSGDQMPQSGRVAPLTDGGRIVGTLTIIEDVSDRVATERELRAQIATAENARATAEVASRVKDEFLATLSHEIRTPLNAVLGWTRILRAREQDAATIRRAIEIIDRNATAQLTLITDMLDIARIAAGKVRLDMTDVDLVAVALSAIDVVRPAADAKGVMLVTDLGLQVPMVRGDADRLLQVVWNLLSNAVKFTPAGGRVTLALAARGGEVQLTVSDTGQGISPAFLPHVFDRFKQADPSSARRHGGLGLGLALVRELVELHGGTATVQSSGLSQGTTFLVAVPARAAGAEAVTSRAARPSASISPAALKDVRVLVVENDIDAGEIVARALSDAGASVHAVSSAAEALSRMVTTGPGDRPHVIVTDIGMPDEDGYALLHDLRQLPPEVGGLLPVIAVTAYASSDDTQRALAAGFTAHLAKPISPPALVSAVRAAVDSGTGPRNSL